MATYYEILGVGQSASAQEIKQAYRSLVKIYHPDKNPGRPEAVQSMVLINEAYNVIKDPVRRAQYDNLISLQTQSESQGSYTTGAREPSQEPLREIPHYKCEKCGKQDSTLRLSIFLSVISYFVLTQKRAHAHVLCSGCRIKYSLLSNLKVWILGWWGFPWGPIYSLEALFKNLQGGEQPVDNNVALLSLLAYDFYTQNRYEECYKVLKASYKLRPDKETKEYMDQIEGLVPPTSRQSPNRMFSTNPVLYNVPFLGALAVVSILLLFPSIWQKGNSGYSQYSQPQQYFQPQPIVDIRSSVEAFFGGYQYFADSMKLAQGLDKSSDVQGDWNKIRASLTNCKESLSRCDTTLMNRIYPGWGDMLSQKFIPAIDHYMVGIKQKPELSSIQKGDAIIVEVGMWWKNNVDALTDKLHRDYGFEFK